jgi:hypothetical protein
MANLFSIRAKYLFFISNERNDISIKSFQTRIRLIAYRCVVFTVIAVNIAVIVAFRQYKLVYH